jgi:hypothetical protein
MIGAHEMNANAGDPPARAEPGAMSETLQAEYRALAASVAAQRERAERLQGLAEHARSQAQRDEEALLDLARILGLDPQTCMEQLDERLRGQRLAEIAVRVLSDVRGVEQPTHYKEWYGLLRAAGYSVAGKDPVASFLAAVSKSPRVRGVGQRSGLYMVVGGAQAADQAASSTPPLAA